MPDPGGVISFAPIVNEIIIPALGIILTGLATAFVTYVFKKFGLEKQGSAREAANRAFLSAASIAVQEAAAAAKPFEEIHTDSAALAKGANYVIEAIPDQLKTLGLTPEKIGGGFLDVIGQKVAARLPEAGANMAAAQAPAAAIVAAQVVADEKAETAALNNQQKGKQP